VRGLSLGERHVPTPRHRPENAVSQRNHVNTVREVLRVGTRQTPRCGPPFGLASMVNNLAKGG
jgi:hypothetical protein